MYLELFIVTVCSSIFMFTVMSFLAMPMELHLCKKNVLMFCWAYDKSFDYRFILWLWSSPSSHLWLVLWLLLLVQPTRLWVCQGVFVSPWRWWHMEPPLKMQVILLPLSAGSSYLLRLWKFSVYVQQCCSSRKLQQSCHEHWMWTSCNLNWTCSCPPM